MDPLFIWFHILKQHITYSTNTIPQKWQAIPYCTIRTSIKITYKTHHFKVQYSIQNMQSKYKSLLIQAPFQFQIKETDNWILCLDTEQSNRHDLISQTIVESERSFTFLGFYWISIIPWFHSINLNLELFSR